MRRSIGVGLLGWIAAARLVGAACDLSFERLDPIVWSGRAGAGYDPLDGVERWQEGRLRIGHRGSPCEYVVAIEGDALDRRARGPDGELRYRLTDEAGRPLESLATVGSGRVAGRFAEGASRAVAGVRISVPAGQFLPPGLYRDEVFLRLFAGDQSATSEADAAWLRLSFEVRASLEVHLEGAAAGGEIDLGDLRVGVSRAFSVSVRGNANYRLRVLSNAGGFLEALGSLEGGRIPYRLLIAGREMSGGAEPSTVSSSAPGAGGQALGATILVSASSSAGAPAGDYRDVLTFSIEAE